MNRRTFLKVGAGVAAATAVPMPLLAALRGGAESVGGVETRELAEGWEFYRGPLDGRYQPWHADELLVWEKVSLPHCFNHYDACDPDVPAYRGEGWYRSKVAVANPFADGRTLLHFEGAGQQSEVWVGGKKIAAHVGGYGEFVVDITEACRALKAGDALPLAIQCSNGRDVERMPSDLSDFTLYGGIYRPLHLVYVPAVSVEAAHTVVAWEPGAPAAKLTVTGRVYAPGVTRKKARVGVVVKDAAGAKVFAAETTQDLWDGEITLASGKIKKPKLWSPDAPNLYSTEVTVEVDGVKSTATHRFGVRHTRFAEHGPFFLNGERFLLQGTQRHEDHAGVAAAMSAELITQEMKLMKAMGANILRLAHYQQRALVLELCDELGIFVWEELPWCRSGVGDAGFQALGKRLMSEMIDQHKNHPAVLIWGLGNEDDWPTELNGKDHDAIRAYMTELRDLSHAADPTRLTGYRRCSFAQDIPDVYSPSIWAGWYSGVYTEYAAALEKARGTVPHFLHVEWGADSHAGRYAEEVDAVVGRVKTGKDTAEKGFDYKMTGGDARVSKDGSWSETYACDLFDWYLKTIEATPWLSGTIQWVFKDFTTPLRVENPVPRVNQKGLLERDMTQKEGYFVFQSYWTKKPMVRVFGHNWPVRWGKAGQERMVRVYSNCKEVELFVNGISAGKKTRDSQDFPCAGLRWNVVFQEGENEVRAVAKDGVSDTVKFRYEARAWGPAAKLALRKVNAAGGIVTVEAEIVDAAGVRCLDSRAQVRFGAAGEGKLIDNLGTPRGSRVVQVYNGRAEISLEKKGAAAVSVQSEGLATALLELV